MQNDDNRNMQNGDCGLFVRKTTNTCTAHLMLFWMATTMLPMFWSMHRQVTPRLTLSTCSQSFIPKPFCRTTTVHEDVDSPLDKATDMHMLTHTPPPPPPLPTATTVTKLTHTHTHTHTPVSYTHLTLPTKVNV